MAQNTLIIKPQYYVEWLNNPPQVFGIAARLGRSSAGNHRAF